MLINTSNGEREFGRLESLNFSQSILKQNGPDEKCGKKELRALD
jgi:hypothetical protein